LSAPAKAKTRPAPRPDPLALVARLAADLRESERQTALARARFEQAVLRCGEIPHGRIAEAAGLSRQRVQQVMAKAAK
jgi:hypothetical protein